MIESEGYELRIEYVQAAWVVLGLTNGMKGNDLIANQLWSKQKRQFCRAEALMQRN